jgi:hypothetical protein
MLKENVDVSPIASKKVNSSSLGFPFYLNHLFIIFGLSKNCILKEARDHVHLPIIHMSNKQNIPMMLCLIKLYWVNGFGDLLKKIILYGDR